jgi:hypothetical protein
MAGLISECGGLTVLLQAVLIEVPARRKFGEWSGGRGGKFVSRKSDF